MSSQPSLPQQSDDDPHISEEEDDLEDYLSPGFDRTTLTTPRPRNILLAHNISYSPSAKKSELLELFDRQILPQVPRLRELSKRLRKGRVGHKKT